MIKWRWPWIPVSLLKKKNWNNFHGITVFMNKLTNSAFTNKSRNHMNLLISSPVKWCLGSSIGPLVCLKHVTAHGYASAFNEVWKREFLMTCPWIRRTPSSMDGLYKKSRSSAGTFSTPQFPSHLTRNFFAQWTCKGSCIMSMNSSWTHLRHVTTNLNKRDIHEMALGGSTGESLT